jgi:hypothetical protein
VNCLYQGQRKSARGYLNRAPVIQLVQILELGASFVSCQHRIVELAWHIVLSPLRGLHLLDNTRSLGHGLHFLSRAAKSHEASERMCAVSEKRKKTDRNDGLRAICGKCSIFTGTLGSLILL